MDEVYIEMRKLIAFENLVHTEEAKRSQISVTWTELWEDI